MKYFLFVLMLILVVNCDNPKEMPSSSSFDLTISGDINGQISDEFGAVSVRCEKGRTIITFSEKIENRPNEADLLVGEIILGIQAGDSTGTYQLTGITERRKANEVGIVGLLEVLTFDELAAQYVSNVERFQNVTEGTIQMEEWALRPKVAKSTGIIKGKLNAFISENEKSIQIKGYFSIVLENTDNVCLEENN